MNLTASYGIPKIIVNSPFFGKVIKVQPGPESYGQGFSVDGKFYRLTGWDYVRFFVLGIPFCFNVIAGNPTPSLEDFYRKHFVHRAIEK